MQVNEPFVKKINPSGIFSAGIKIAVFLFSIGVIYTVLLEKKHWLELFAQTFFKENGLYVFAAMLAAMFANISVEAIKWKRLVKSITVIPFSTSLMAVYSGIVAGIITPHGIGDYVGRVLFIHSEKRFESIGSVLFSRVAQLCITCITGVAAVIYFYFFIEEDAHMLLALAVACVTLVLICVAWNYRAWLLDKMKHVPLLKNIEKWFEQLRMYNNLLFAETLGLSAFRYLIFLSQFVCLLMYFGVDLPIEILITGSVFTFFVKSVIPSFLDIGVRELAAVFFFSAYHIADEKVLLASLSLWFFNLLIPAVIGLFCMFKIEYRKRT
ncbi:hypothetical protein CHU_2184 [Cytophaga hutchinsonii ATCC 33406]|uniref:Uncharacterized protein n=1 Tax=Cytophaga hutchinsonii (strain ATCC 33406 / DSM 1761 / CIP 103989 / NBRC 15051 / NCIMB 9469 / D465) TaxID=269798 RepID=A0A6N4SST9_CYTH3|nr:hypothetical protein CHU_2184 [Cytophaga hutchinsonii ATCC 33406]SFX96293.1 Uncharacterized membrane protein YbhN, UPF0104 family [Cytophaga hutchinsonii ATCC 33406]